MIVREKHSDLFFHSVLNPPEGCLNNSDQARFDRRLGPCIARRQYNKPTAMVAQCTQLIARGFPPQGAEALTHSVVVQGASPISFVHHTSVLNPTIGCNTVASQGLQKIGIRTQPGSGHCANWPKPCTSLSGGYYVPSPRQPQPLILLFHTFLIRLSYQRLLACYLGAGSRRGMPWKSFLTSPPPWSKPVAAFSRMGLRMSPACAQLTCGTVRSPAICTGMY